MIFLGSFCGSVNSMECTPTAISDVQYVELRNGIYNDLYITSNPESLTTTEEKEIEILSHGTSPLLIKSDIAEQVDSLKIYFTNNDATIASKKIYLSDGTSVVNLSFEKTLGGVIIDKQSDNYNYIDDKGNKWLCDAVEIVYNKQNLELIYDWHTTISDDKSTFVISNKPQLEGRIIDSNPDGSYPVDYLNINDGSTTFSVGYIDENENVNSLDLLSIEVKHVQKNTVVQNLDDVFVWNWDTVLYSSFNGTTEAGNVDFTLENTTDLIIKRRKQDEFVWKTIWVQSISELKDFDIKGVDTTARSATTYEYAAVAVRDGIEGTYNKMTVDSEFDKIYLVEGDQMYGTSITDGFCDTTRNFPSSITPLLNNKYPIYIRNSSANYDSGSLSLGFVDTETCPYNFEDKNRTPYQKKLMDFLCDAKPKLLKLPDGRMWLIIVTGNPTDNAENHYSNRKINFEWTEIGDCESEKDLYYANLIDVTEEWWVS